MSGLEIGLLSVAAIIILVYSGMYVAVALCLTSLVGVWIIKGNFTLAANLLALAAYDAVSGYVFGVVPLYVLMGLLVSVAGVGRDAFSGANVVLGKVKGGLALATVGGNTIFAAVTGISIASATIFTKIAVPEMLRAGYRPRFAVGVVAGSSVLGMLIPPSLLMIVYGLIAEQSIGDLFIAGVVPGLLLATAFGLMILGYAYFLPHLVQDETKKQKDEFADMSGREALIRLIPLCILVFVVIGGIYAGWFTPTESGAVGALGAFLMAAWRRQLNLSVLWRILTETGHITVAIMFLIISANLYGRLLAFSGMPTALNAWVVAHDFSFYALLIIYAVIVVFLGCLIDAVSIMLIMVPMFLPLLKGYNVDLVWFGIVTVIAAEMGLLTPPMGLSVFAVKSTLDDKSISLGDIFAGSLPYTIMMFCVLLLIIFFPSIALVLIR
jgi:tripartite ATP-independent transporter DctM subunit